MIAPVGIENHMTLLNARGSVPLFKVCEEKPKSVTISQKGIQTMKKNRIVALLLLSLLFPSCAKEETADQSPIPGESDKDELHHILRKERKAVSQTGR